MNVSLVSQCCCNQWKHGSGLSSQGALSHAWRMLLYAIEDGYRSEATKLVELQTENDALKAAMRHFKVQAQRNAAKLRSLSPASEYCQGPRHNPLQFAFMKLTPVAPGGCGSALFSVIAPSQEEGCPSSTHAPELLHLSSTKQFIEQIGYRT